MEKMTEKEKAALKELQAKAKRIEREKKKILSEADELKDEILARWGITQTAPAEVVPQRDIWKEIYTAYGINEFDQEGQQRLFDHLTSDKQVNYYRNYGTNNWR